MIKNQKFRDKRTGEIVTRFSILDTMHMEEIKEDSIAKSLKKLSKAGK